MNIIRSFLFGGTGTATSLGDLGLLVVRFIFGGLMLINHGYGKIFGGGSIGPGADFVRTVERLGFPSPTLFAWAGALTEFGCSVLVAIGLLTRPAALALTFMMAVAAFGRHWSDPLEKKEMALLYMATFFLILLIGGGRFSIDSLFRKQRKSLPKRSDT
jgi:putative oxidoreductase